MTSNSTNIHILLSLIKLVFKNLNPKLYLYIVGFYIIIKAKRLLKMLGK